MRTWRWMIAAIAAMSADVGTAIADESALPRMSGELTVEIQDNWAARSDDVTAERNDLFNTTTAVLATQLKPEISIGSTLKFEPVQDQRPGRDRTFDDHGLYVEELFVRFASGVVEVRAGKFGQPFGIAWDASPGIWGTDFAEDYELAEQIGLGATAALAPDGLGTHAISLGAFFQDTSALAGSKITRRARNRRSSGGAGNTGDLSSFVAALDGADVPGLPGLAYHIAHSRRGKDGRGGASESGSVAALAWTGNLGEFELAPLVEYAWFADRSGTAGTDSEYLTTGIRITWQAWNLGVSRTGRTTEAAGEADVDGRLVQVTAGYAFPNGIGLNAGWRGSRESGVDTDTYGFLVDYTVSF